MSTRFAGDRGSVDKRRTKAKRLAMLLFALTTVTPLIPAYFAVTTLAQGDKGHQIHIAAASALVLVFFLAQVVHAVTLVRCRREGRTNLKWSHFLLCLLGPLGVLIVALEAARAR